MKRKDNKMTIDLKVKAKYLLLFVVSARQLGMPESVVVDQLSKLYPEENVRGRHYKFDDGTEYDVIYVEFSEDVNTHIMIADDFIQVGNKQIKIYDVLNNWDGELD